MWNILGMLQNFMMGDLQREYKNMLTFNIHHIVYDAKNSHWNDKLWNMQMEM
jgi:hypothetical protein